MDERAVSNPASYAPRRWRAEVELGTPIPYGWQLGLSSGAAAHRSSTLVLSISREGGVVVRRGGSRSGSAQEAIDPLLAKIVGPDA